MTIIKLKKFQSTHNIEIRIQLRLDIKINRIRAELPEIFGNIGIGIGVMTYATQDHSASFFSILVPFIS